jgi:starch synthase
LASRGDHFSGILNGADLHTWNPTRDPFLPAPYSASDLVGKERCRTVLAKSLNLRLADGPLAGMVSRLVDQKGLDLVLASIEPMIAAGFSLVVLGTGQQRYREQLQAAAERQPGRIVFRDEFDEALAHRIVAGCDLYLMPSRFEPCGLTQMYALRYGSLPVVRRTGGLADTVREAAEPAGTGFLFQDYRVDDFVAALTRARTLWDDQAEWARVQQRGMHEDFGWDQAAGAYEELYERLVTSEVRQP